MAEAADVAKTRPTNGRQVVGSAVVGRTSPDNSLTAECRKEDSKLHPLRGLEPESDLGKRDLLSDV
jgi:hypothetical protein